VFEFRKRHRVVERENEGDKSRSGGFLEFRSYFTVLYYRAREVKNAEDPFPLRSSGLSEKRDESFYANRMRALKGLSRVAALRNVTEQKTLKTNLENGRQRRKNSRRRPNLWQKYHPLYLPIQSL
jgi:hypothetical protein